jgi:hypothetical protein
MPIKKVMMTPEQSQTRGFSIILEEMTSSGQALYFSHTMFAKAGKIDDLLLFSEAHQTGNPVSEGPVGRNELKFERT